MRTLVIGIGHPDRGDDAIGRIVAAQLKGRTSDGVTVIECPGEAASLLDLLEGADEAIIIDAAASDGRPGTIHRLDAVAGSLPAGMFAMSTHSMGLADSIELARALGQLPRRCVVFAVEGQGFGLGEPLSPPVEKAVGDVVARVLDELGGEAA